MAKDDLFIPQGAFLTCDKGAAVMTLKATPKKHNLYALPIATESDNVPLVNIPCFGVCSINGSACMPVAPQWKSVHGGAQKVLGKAPLISTSYCKCQKGGNIKIFLDRKAAEAALGDDKKSRVDGIPWLDDAIGNALLGPVGIIVNKAYGSDDVSEGIGRGFRKGLKGTWNFLSDDMWKGDTWKGMGKMAAVGVVGYGGAIIPGYGPTQRLKDFDKTFGTELNQTHEAIGNAISSTWDEKVVNGTAAERSELAGQTAEMVLEAVVGSKGAGAVAKGSMAGAKMALGAERVAEIAESIAKLRQAVKLENLAAKVKGIFKVGAAEVKPLIKSIDDFVPTSGTKLVGSAKKTTTIAGRWKGDMEFIKGKMNPEDFNVGTPFGTVENNKGGFNFLDIPENLYDEATFFDSYNKPWLEKAVGRGDDFVLATKPVEKIDLIAKNGKLKGMFAREIEFLVKKDYKPINVSQAEWNTIKSWF